MTIAENVEQHNTCQCIQDGPTIRRTGAQRPACWKKVTKIGSKMGVSLTGDHIQLLRILFSACVRYNVQFGQLAMIKVVIFHSEASIT
jgi:hypothetical protein